MKSHRSCLVNTFSFTQKKQRMPIKCYAETASGFQVKQKSRNLRFVPAIRSAARAFCLLLLLNTANPARAQNSCSAPSFGTANSFGTGISPAAIATGDFNGDGKLDLAVVNSGSGSIGVLLNNGAGSFNTAGSFSVGSNPQSITTADFNSDGKLDLAVANAYSYNVSVRLGAGDGSFGAATNFGTGSYPTFVTAADFNGDGKVDLAVTNSYSDNVSVLPGNGTGGFGTATNTYVGAYSFPQSAATGDFNGDGKTDIAVVNYGYNNISVLLNNGAGGFGLPVNLSAGSGPYSIVAADFNGDGNSDLAVANVGSNNVLVYRGDGTGGFAGGTGFVVGKAPNSITTGDFDGNGTPDLATANLSSDNVSVLLNNGTDSFSPAVNFGVDDGSLFVTTGDFNGDGKTDLTTANSNSNSVSVLLNTIVLSTFYRDADGDGYGDAARTATGPAGCTPAGYATNNADCNDNNNSIHPGAAETPDDGIDQDCDGFDLKTFYHDADQDTYGSAADTVHANTQPQGYVTNNGDCDDTNASINPTTIWVLDADGDGYYTGTPVTQCAPPGNGYVVKAAQTAGDCNDGDAAIHEPQQYYVDADGDGYGSITTASFCAATAPVGYATNNEDCNDGNPSINPTTMWVLDADKDGYYTGNPITQCASPGSNYEAKSNQTAGDCNDSDASIHQSQQYYVDADKDGYGSTTTAMLCSATAPAGYATNNSDCNDGDATINPTTTWVLDADGDGYYTGSPVTQCAAPAAGYVKKAAQVSGDCDDGKASVYPGAVEVCGNGVDDNCNGQVDEGCSTISATLVPSFTVEGDKDKRPMLFVVALNKLAPSNISVKYKTVDGTAKAGSDYQSAEGTISFSKGQWLKFITVNVYGDKQVEGNEQFSVQLYNPVGVKLYGTGKATGTIFNDDRSQQNNIITSAAGLQIKEASEVPALVVPNLLHRSQVWHIPNLPATNELLVYDAGGRLVWRTINYAGNKAFSNIAAGLYYYNLVVRDKEGKPLVYKGKLMITE